MAVLWDRKTRFKSIFVLMECYMTSPTLDKKKGVRKYRRSVGKLQNGYRTSSIINDLGKKGTLQ